MDCFTNLPNSQSKRPLNDPPKSQFCFTHLTVQEFFAAKHLVDTECETKGEIEIFVRKHINDGTWQVVLEFVAGLLKGSSSDIFITLLPESTEENIISPQTRPLTYWPATEEKDKYLAVQVCKCLYEINDAQQPVFQKTAWKLKFHYIFNTSSQMSMYNSSFSCPNKIILPIRPLLSAILPLGHEIMP